MWLASRLRGRRATAALCLLVALPFLISAIHAAVTGWVPTWDNGFVQLRVLDVGTRRTPLIGMPSTVSDVVATEIHHPGPMQFWLLALPTRLLTHFRWGLTFAQSVLDAVVAAVAVFAAKAVGGTNTAWWAAGGVLAVAVAIGDEPLHDPWNPTFGLICLLACTACVLALTRRTVPWVVAAVTITASCVAQAHLVGLLQAVVLVTLAAVVVVRRDGWREARRPLLWGLAGGLVAWLGPILDQLIHSPGNMRALLSGAGETGASYGLRQGFDRFARVVTPPGLLKDGVPGLEFDGGLLLARLGAAAGLTAVGVLWWRRQRRGAPTGLPLVTCVAVVSGIVAQATTPVTFASFWGRHIWSFLWPAALLVWACVALLVVDEVVPRLARGRALVPRPWAPPAALGAGLVCVVLAVLTSPLTEQRDGQWFTTVNSVDDAVPIGPLHGAVVIRGEGIPIESELVAGVAADLQRRGVFVRFVGPLAAGLVHARHSGPAPVASLVFTAGDLAEPDDGELLIEVESPTDRVESPIRVYLVPAP